MLNRGSQGAQERAEHPNRSDQGDLDETLPLRSEIHENTAHAQQNRRPGASVGSQIEPANALLGAQGERWQPDRASRSQIEPAKASQVARLLAQVARASEGS